MASGLSGQDIEEWVARLTFGEDLPFARLASG